MAGSQQRKESKGAFVIPFHLHYILKEMSALTFFSCPNIGKHFVKLYAVFQKLDHLTCSELNL